MINSIQAQGRALRKNNWVELNTVYIGESTLFKSKILFTRDSFGIYINCIDLELYPNASAHLQFTAAAITGFARIATPHEILRLRKTGIFKKLKEDGIIPKD